MEEAGSNQNKTKPKHVSVEESGEALTHRLLKQRRQSQGYPTHDIIESEEEDAVDPESYIKDKMRGLRRHSMGYPQDSDSEGMEDIDLNST
jgi:hypothetical protein